MADGDFFGWVSMERTFIAIKPDGVQRGLVGEILQRFERRGYKIVALKCVQVSEALAKAHYADLSERPFFPGLVAFITSSPVVAIVLEGKDAVATGRTMIGATNPLSSAPGTIRGDYGIDVGRNIIHGSDSVASAEREIALWFAPSEVIDWQANQAKWIYEKV